MRKQASTTAFRVPGWMLAVGAAALIAIAAREVALCRQMKARNWHEHQEKLHAALDYKREQLLFWREGQYSNARMLAQNRIMIKAVEQWQKNPGEAGLRRNIIEWLNDWQDNYHYFDVLLTDIEGNIMLAADGAVDVLSLEWRTNVREAVATRQPLLSDMYLCSVHGQPHLDLFAPLITREGRRLGAVALRILPATYLYPLMKKNAFNSRTFETSLVRQEGDSILFLNDIRFRQNAALRLKVPLAQREAPEAKAVLVGRTVGQGIDYRGQKVLAVTGRIPGTGWGIVAKTDLDEINGPLRLRGQLRGMTLLLALLAAGAGAAFIVFNQRKEHYKKLYLMETERRALVKHYEYLTKYANDIIFLLDENRKIVEVNERAVEEHGYSRDEMIGRDADFILAKEEREQFRKQMIGLAAGGSLLYEARHQRKNGTTFPVEISARAMEIEGKKYLQGIVRNITERKIHELAIQERNEGLEAANQELEAAEEELRQSNDRLENNYAELESANEELRVADEELKSQVDELVSTRNELQKEKRQAEVLIDSAPNLVIGLGNDAEILIFNRYAEKITGYRREEVLDRNWMELFIPAESRKDVLNVWQKIWAEELSDSQYENPVVDRDGRKHLIAWNNKLIKREGEFDMILSMGVDVTEKREAERGLAEASARWSSTFDVMSDSIAILGADQTILQVNQSFLRQLNMAPADVVGRKCYELMHPEKHPHWGCPFDRMRESRKRETATLEAGDKVFNVVLEPFIDALGAVSGAVHLFSDITSQQMAERKIREQLSELQRWQKVVLDREDRVWELKSEINHLLAELGQQKRYEDGRHNQG